MIAWLTAKLGILRWIVLGLAMITSAWATHRIDNLLQTEADAKKTTTIIQALPQIIHETSTITKVIHDANDACASRPVDPAILGQLR